jgi:hypothetical protein
MSPISLLKRSPRLLGSVSKILMVEIVGIGESFLPCCSLSTVNIYWIHNNSCASSGFCWHRAGSDPLLFDVRY